MKVLITGGAGFMGSNMVRYILEEYPTYQVLNFDKLTYAANLENLHDISDDPRYTFFEGDISDDEAVERACKDFQPDVILNYAAETHVDRSILHPKVFLDTQIMGTHTLLEAIKQFAIPRMVQISTDEVYGSIDEGEFTEGSPFLPNSPYSAAKAGADHLCRAYWTTYQTPTIVTHSCNVYGPYQFPDKLMSRFITNLIEGKKLPINGKGEHVREWIYVRDHCRAVDRIMHDGTIGETYNIGTGERTSNLETTHMILRIFGKGEEEIEFVKDRPGNDHRYATDTSKIQQQLGWHPEMTLEEGLQKTIAWFQEHHAWWRPLKNSEEHIGFFRKMYLDDEKTKDLNI